MYTFIVIKMSVLPKSNAEVLHRTSDPSAYLRLILYNDHYSANEIQDDAKCELFNRCFHDWSTEFIVRFSEEFNVFLYGNSSPDRLSGRQKAKADAARAFLRSLYLVSKKSDELAYISGDPFVASWLRIKMGTSSA